MLNQHVLVCIVNNGEDVWGYFSPSLTTEVVDDVICVDWQPPVRIDCHAEETRVCLSRRGLDSEIETNRFPLISYPREHIHHDRKTFDSLLSFEELL